MKTISLIASFILYSIYATGQLKHSFALDYNIYGNVFSSPQQGFFSKENYRYFWPQISYTVKKGKQSLSLSALIYGKELYYRELKEGDLYRYENTSFNALYGYEIWEKKNFAFNLNAGLNYGKYSHSSVAWMPDPYEYILDGGKEWALGLVIGANPRLKVWNGFFVNGNFRYTLNPFTHYTRHSNTLYIGVGLGYEFGKSRN
ncbi:hypothetical protein [Edaphocola flava]|uniref:hypothetical protein n=1 Tax=Edaphocola flava TaxID=2499629 RepID=UPI00100A5891|nr:hypothetical protein [Edaphocola flava]